MRNRVMSALIGVCAVGAVILTGCQTEDNMTPSNQRVDIGTVGSGVSCVQLNAG